MYIKADLHIHTSWSDGKLSIREVIDLYSVCGFDCIVITDHSHDTCVPSVLSGCFDAYLADIRENQEYAAQRGMLLIPGIEVSADRFHVGVLDVKQYISHNQSIQDVVDQAHQQGALVIANHPGPVMGKYPQQQHYEDFYEDLANTLSMVDAVEIANGNQLFPEAARIGRPYVGNTDFHVPDNLRSWKNLLEVNELTIPEIKNAVGNCRNFLWRYTGDVPIINTD